MGEMPILDTCTEVTASLLKLPGGRGGKFKLPTLTELHQYLFDQPFAEAHNATAEKLQEFQAAQGQISAALGRLIMLKETYPELKADKNFIELQAQIEGTENRISVERTRFNESAQEYNTAIRTFPRNIVASFGNFEAKPYFEADKAAEKAPTVKF
jgi:LemA protein